MKKAQMSMQYIAGFILVLLILVIVSSLIIGKFREGKKALGCSGRGGICIKELDSCPEDKPIKIYDYECSIVKDNKREPGPCCLPIGG